MAGWACQFVIAGAAATFAVKQSVDAEAHIELGLAIHAEFFAVAALFGPFALGANDATYSGS